MATTRYYATLPGQKEPVILEVEVGADGRYIVRHGDERHEIDALSLEHGAVSLIIDGASHSVEFEEREDDVAVLLNGQVFHIDVADERRRRLRSVPGAFHAEGRQVVVAPMPGKVTKVLVKLGDEVKEGQGLIVVEAMKMENELKSPKAGKIVELTAKEGTAVEMNHKLCVVE